MRHNLLHLLTAFPVLIASEDPPGIPLMKERKDKIRYVYESIANGGKVVRRALSRLRW
jgi:hypothetical protein